MAGEDGEETTRAVVLPDHFDSPAKKAVILELLKEYPVQRVAAAKAGIRPETISRWRAADEHFSDLVDRAVEIGKSVMFDRIKKASEHPSNWQAAAWILERLDPATYGRIDRAQVQVSGPGGGPVVTAAIDLSSESLGARLQEVMGVLKQAGRLPAGMEGLLADGARAEPDAGTEDSATPSPAD